MPQKATLDHNCNDHPEEKVSILGLSSFVMACGTILYAVVISTGHLTGWLDLVISSGPYFVFGVVIPLVLATTATVLCLARRRQWNRERKAYAARVLSEQTEELT